MRLDPVDRQDAVGAGGVDVEVQRAAVGVVGDDDGLHRRADLAVEGVGRHPELGQRRQLALGGGAAVAAHRRDDERRRAEVAQPGDRARAAARRAPVRPRLPAPTATVIPSSTAPARRSTTSSRAAPSTSATAGGSGTGSSTRVSGGTVIDGSIGSATPAWSWSHPTTADGTGFTGRGGRPRGPIRRRDLRARHDDRACRLVIGHWPTSPFGPFADAMVEHADGHRVLHRAEPTRWPPTSAASTSSTSVVVTDGRRPTARAGAAALPRRPARSPTSTIGRRDAPRLGAAGRAARGRHEPDLGDASSTRSPAPSCAACAPAARRPGGEEFYGATDRHRVVAVVATWDGADLGAAGRRRPAGALRLQLRRRGGRRSWR